VGNIFSISNQKFVKLEKGPLFLRKVIFYIFIIIAIKYSRPCVTIRNKLFFYEGLLAPRPTIKLEDNPPSAIPDCSFSISAPRVPKLWNFLSSCVNISVSMAPFHGIG